MDYSALQTFMHARKISAWLVYDFRGSNAILPRLLPPAPGQRRWTTRRLALYVPADAQPVLMVHGIDAGQFPHEATRGVRVEKYLSWKDWHNWIQSLGRDGQTIAMEYSPMAALPVVSIVDAGTIELVRASGAQVVSSADLVQVAAARWSGEARSAHGEASRQVNAIKDAAFEFIGQRLSSGSRSVMEHEVAEHIREGFRTAGLEWPDGPIVSANEHAADPHYEPSAAHPCAIRPGDWVLIDLWARRPGEQHIFSDITWVGYAGAQPPARHAEVFRVVRAARDAALRAAQEGWKAGRAVQGWELDDAARNVIVSAGFERGLRHRTGHSLSPGTMVHGVGMNLDNLETHDTRQMLPGTGFTIEPGVYLPDERFGIRSEINVYVDEQTGPVVTSSVQREIVLIG